VINIFKKGSRLTPKNLKSSKGLYNGSIIMDFFIRKKTTFKALDYRLFE
jgi:hypothetical protein